MVDSNKILLTSSKFFFRRFRIERLGSYSLNEIATNEVLKKWIEAGFNPSDAYIWDTTGYSLKEAKKLRDMGYDPFSALEKRSELEVTTAFLNKIGKAEAEADIKEIWNNASENARIENLNLYYDNKDEIEKLSKLNWENQDSKFKKRLINQFVRLSEKIESNEKAEEVRAVIPITSFIFDRKKIFQLGISEDSLRDEWDTMLEDQLEDILEHLSFKPRYAGYYWDELPEEIKNGFANYLQTQYEIFEYEREVGHSMYDYMIKNITSKLRFNQIIGKFWDSSPYRHKANILNSLKLDKQLYFLKWNQLKPLYKLSIINHLKNTSDFYSKLPLNILANKLSQLAQINYTSTISEKDGSEEIRLVIENLKKQRQKINSERSEVNKEYTEAIRKLSNRKETLRALKNYRNEELKRLRNTLNHNKRIITNALSNNDYDNIIALIEALKQAEMCDQRLGEIKRNEYLIYDEYHGKKTQATTIQDMERKIAQLERESKLKPIVLEKYGELGREEIHFNMDRPKRSNREFSYIDELEKIVKENNLEMIATKKRLDILNKEIAKNEKLVAQEEARQKAIIQGKKRFKEQAKTTIEESEKKRKEIEAKRTETTPTATPSPLSQPIPIREPLTPIPSFQEEQNLQELTRISLAFNKTRRIPKKAIRKDGYLSVALLKSEKIPDKIKEWYDDNINNEGFREIIQRRVYPITNNQYLIYNAFLKAFRDEFGQDFLNNTELGYKYDAPNIFWQDIENWISYIMQEEKIQLIDSNQKIINANLKSFIDYVIGYKKEGKSLDTIRKDGSPSGILTPLPKCPIALIKIMALNNILNTLYQTLEGGEIKEVNAKNRKDVYFDRDVTDIGVKGLSSPNEVFNILIEADVDYLLGLMTEDEFYNTIMALATEVELSKHDILSTEIGKKIAIDMINVILQKHKFEPIKLKTPLISSKLDYTDLFKICPKEMEEMEDLWNDALSKEQRASALKEINCKDESLKDLDWSKLPKKVQKKLIKLKKKTALTILDYLYSNFINTYINATYSEIPKWEERFLEEFGEDDEKWQVFDEYSRSKLLGEISLWMSYGFSLEIAIEERKKGLTPKEAFDFHQYMTKESAYEYSEISLITDMAFLGLDFDDIFNSFILDKYLNSVSVVATEKDFKVWEARFLEEFSEAEMYGENGMFPNKEVFYHRIVTLWIGYGYSVDKAVELTKLGYDPLSAFDTFGIGDNLSEFKGDIGKPKLHKLNIVSFEELPLWESRFQEEFGVGYVDEAWRNVTDWRMEMYEWGMRGYTLEGVIQIKKDYGLSITPKEAYDIWGTGSLSKPRDENGKVIQRHYTMTSIQYKSLMKIKLKKKKNEENQDYAIQEIEKSWKKTWNDLSLSEREELLKEFKGKNIQENIERSWRKLDSEIKEYLKDISIRSAQNVSSDSFKINLISEDKRFNLLKYDLTEEKILQELRKLCYIKISSMNSGIDEKKATETLKDAFIKFLEGHLLSNGETPKYYASKIIPVLSEFDSEIIKILTIEGITNPLKVLESIRKDIKNEEISEFPLYMMIAESIKDYAEFEADPDLIPLKEISQAYPYGKKIESLLSKSEEKIIKILRHR